jgi:hypothetical protein
MVSFAPPPPKPQRKIATVVFDLRADVDILAKRKITFIYRPQMYQCQDLKFVTALHLSACLTIIRRVKFKTTALASAVRPHCTLDRQQACQKGHYMWHRRRNYIDFI